MKDEHVSITGNAPHSPFLKKGALDNTGNSIKYKVGERFPHSQYLNYGEITVSVFNDTFFDILSCLYDLSGKEIKIFQNGDFQFSMFTFEGVPFICINFSGADLSFDLSSCCSPTSCPCHVPFLSSTASARICRICR